MWITRQASQQMRSQVLQLHPVMKMEDFPHLKYRLVEILRQDEPIVPVELVQQVLYVI